MSRVTVIFTLVSSSYCMSKVAFSNSLIIVHSKFFQQFPVIFCLLCSTVLFIYFFVTYLQLTFICKIDRIIYTSARCLRTILIFQKSDFKIVHARTHTHTHTHTHAIKTFAITFLNLRLISLKLSYVILTDFGYPV